MVKGIGKDAFVSEHLEFLHMLPPEVPMDEHPFGFIHQSLLRVIVTAVDPSGDDLEGIVERYWRVPEQRHRLREFAQSVLAQQIGPHSALAASAAEASRFLDADTLRQPFEQRLAPEGSVVIDCDYGYAEFSDTELRTTASGLPYRWAPIGARATIGAMMFYGSAPEPTDPPLIQELPVRVIAATSRSLSEGPIPEVRDDWTVARLVADLRGSAVPDLEAAFVDLFVRHEHGHRASPQSLVHARVADAAGVPVEEVVTCEFPDRYRRGSWSRLTRGVGSRSDALYLLGDLLANLKAIEMDGSERTWGLLRAFNWRFVGPREPIRLPRGNAVLLAYDGLMPALEHALAWIEEVLAAVCARPAMAAEVLVAAELSAWSTLVQSHRR